MTDNLLESLNTVQIPVYFFHGLHDYQTSHLVAKEYFEHLKAPKKELFTFKNSAHSPIFDEPERFNKKLR